MPGSFPMLASTPLPPISTVMPASAVINEIARSSDSRSPRIGHARNATQTGIDIPSTAASLAPSHSSASPMNATQPPIVSIETSSRREPHSRRHAEPLAPRQRDQGQCRSADNAAQPARRQRRPLRQQMFHDREIESPPHRRDGEEDEAERRYPGAARVARDRHGGGLGSENGAEIWFRLTQTIGIRSKQNLYALYHTDELSLFRLNR